MDFTQLKRELISLKEYRSVATVNSAGMEEVGGSRLTGKYSRWYEGHLTHDRKYKCDNIDIKYYKKVLTEKNYLYFPFRM